ncbi:NlpC/P60 family protein [Macrococcus sp. EM39E]|uniref:C40 family peptidase n=1 Tax=Macrococcus animalis TaxID=3395467 RepID=UPI0039BDC1AB
MTKVCSVPVSTVWRSIDKVRDIDNDATSYPTNIQKWLLSLNLEQKLSFCEDSRIDTQLLYGEPLEILEDIGDWCKVVCIEQVSESDDRGYPGYIPKSHIGEIEGMNHSVGHDNRFARIIIPRTLSYKADAPYYVFSFNTTLPVHRIEDAFVYVYSPDGILKLKKEAVSIQSTRLPEQNPSYNALYEAASMYIDLGYLWGGMSSYGYDCSGFVYHMYRHIGIDLPRDAHEQYFATTPIDKSELLPGDLVYFSNDKDIDKISHIGIYIGNGFMIHSPNTPLSIEERTIESGLYEEIYVGASRVYDFTNS